MDLVRDTLPPDDADIVLKIPVYEDAEDFPAWHFDPRGIFSVKSAYKVHMYGRMRDERSSSSLPDGEQWKATVWNGLWSFDCPPKTRHFLWRFSLNSHPLRMNIARRGVELDTRCAVCHTLFEDGNHLFFKCKLVKMR